jgi:hypothetical protein
LADSVGGEMGQPDKSSVFIDAMAKSTNQIRRMARPLDR